MTIATVPARACLALSFAGTERCLLTERRHQFRGARFPCRPNGPGADRYGEESMQVRRAVPDETARASAGWRPRAARATPWILTGLPGRATRAVVDASCLAAALLLAALLRHDGHIQYV